jgi:nicotinamidase-related amidase
VKTRLLTAAAIFAALALPAKAANIIDEWTSVKAPAAPPLKEVKVDSKTTALLVLDLLKQSCNEERRPRCVASIPAVAKFQATAREKGIMVVNTILPIAKVEDVVPAVAPKAGEPVISAWVDKFMVVDKDTGLQKMLKDKGITTVIPVGTASYGAVLYTGSAAALRGFNVVVPVDGMSSEDLYFDQASTWLLAKGTGGIGPKVTLTTFDMIKF